VRCVAHDEDIRRRHIVREPPDTRAHHLRSVEAFVAKGAVPKILANAVVLQLHPGRLAEVARRKSQADAVALLEGFEQMGEAGLQMTVALL